MSCLLLLNGLAWLLPQWQYYSLGLEATVYGQKDERDKQAEIKAKIGTMTKE